MQTSGHTSGHQRTAVGEGCPEAGCPEEGCPEAEAVSMKAEDYKGIVGSLLFVAKQTTPDILATVTQLSRFLENPGSVHCVAAKRVHRYLKGSKELELCYTKDAGGVNSMDPQMLTRLEIRMIESQLLATAFICRRQGQQLAGAPRSNKLQLYLPVRLRTSSRGFLSAMTSR